MVPRQMFKWWGAYFGVAKGNLLSLLGILDSTIANTKAKALISPIHYPEVHILCLLTLSHLLTLRQNVSIIERHLWYSWYTTENSCWPIYNYPVTECCCGGNLCLRDHGGCTKSLGQSLNYCQILSWEAGGERAINLDNAQHCWRARAL